MPGSGEKGERNVSRTLDHPQVTEDLLQEVVRRMLAVGAPSKIVLFGSRARGDARADSDLDLLIIEASDLPRYKRSPRYLRALIGLFPAKDVVVWTPEEVEHGQRFRMPLSPRPYERERLSMHNKFDHVRGWFLKAESDLHTVKSLLESDGPYDQKDKAAHVSPREENPTGD